MSRAFRTYPKRTSRRRRRGAALVEGLIVAATLALCLSCATFFHGLYHAKIAAVGEARLQAWRDALPGCEASAFENMLSGIEAIADLRGDSLQAQPSAVFEAGEPIVRNATSSPVNMGPLLGGRVFRPRGAQSVACNEQGSHEEDDSQLTTIFDGIRHLAPW